MSDTKLELRRVTKRYGTQIVLDAIDVAVGTGELVVIVGRSGSGKSTLLRVLGGLEYPDGGEVLHDGLDITTLDERERARFRRQSLGFVFQFFNLLPTLTAAENIALPLTLNHMQLGATTERVDALLEELDIRNCRDKFPDQLSGGEQQRVAIARAVAHEPKLIIADEPTGNLDDATARSVISILESACRRRSATLIMATHAPEVIGLADRVLALGGGKLASRAP